MAALVENAAATARPRRRWFQFRLRTLLVLLTLCALVFALLAAQWRRHAAEIAALRSLGAAAYASKRVVNHANVLVNMVEGDGDVTNGRAIACFSVPPWLRRVPGVAVDGMFSRVDTLVLGAPTHIGPLSASDWRQLEVFRDLRSLTVEGRQITTHDIARCSRFPALRRLNLVGSTFQPESFATVARCRGLTSLDLDGSNITDADLAALASLDQLEVLGLAHTQVTDEGLEHLRSLKSLRKLELAGSRVTDDGVDLLRTALPQLDLLDD